MPSTFENIRVSGTMLLRGGMALSPIIAAYQGRSLIPPPAPGAITQSILALLSASSLPTLIHFTPMLLGTAPPASKSPLFFPVTTFVVLTDVFSWAATLLLARQGKTGRGGWLLDRMAGLQITSSVLLGLGSVVRKYLYSDPSLGWVNRVQWELLFTTLAHLGGATALLFRRRWERV